MRAIAKNHAAVRAEKTGPTRGVAAFIAHPLGRGLFGVGVGLTAIDDREFDGEANVVRRLDAMADLGRYSLR